MENRVRPLAGQRHTGSVDEEHVAAGADGVQYVDDFVCTCGDDKQAAADELREEARRILEAGTDDWCPGPVSDRDYLSAAVGWLDHHHCHIAEIITDQWSLVRVVERRWNRDTSDIETTLVLRIQCDRVGDGVARAVQFVAQRSSP
jgi:hypothetical protein